MVRKLLFAVIAFFFTYLFFLFSPKAASAQVCQARANALSSELLGLSASGVRNFLYWQYSGGANDGTTMSSDVYSFYKGDPLCQVLRDNAGRFTNLGVNMYNLGSYSTGIITDALDYLRNNCGINIIRIWATPDRLNGVESAIQLAGQRGIQVIVTLWDTVNNSSNGGNWFRDKYQTVGYLDHLRNAATRLRGYSNIFAYELANEPHCNGDATCVPDYVAWVRAAAQAIRSVDSSHRIGIGQIAAQPGTRGDSAGAGNPSDFIQSNNTPLISVASAHYYSLGEMSNVLQVLAQATSIGKTFYIGERGIDCDAIDPGPPGPPGPPPPPYVPARYDCKKTTNPEFHALRPYPASPCDRNILQVTDYCANDVIVQETFTGLRPQDAQSCIGDASTGQTCTFIYPNRQYGVSLDFSDAELPIAGNTQLVPNEVNRGRPLINLGDAERVNEYLSWYLSGLSGSASERVAGTNRTINYSGPLKKILPEAIQRHRRQQTINLAGFDRHNQIVSCMRGGSLVRCLSVPNVPIPPIIWRLSDLAGIPLEQNYPTYDLFKLAYAAWNLSIQRKSFDYIPFKTTEDRPSLVVATASATSPVSLAEGNQNLTPDGFSFNSTNNNEVLFFSHMSEVADLSQLLINTYLPSNLYVGTQTVPYSFSPQNYNRCDLNGRWNSGDDLYGELAGTDFNAFVSSGTGTTVEVQNPPAIAGTINQPTITFQCVFPPMQTDPGSCYANCTAVPPVTAAVCNSDPICCEAACYNPRCNRVSYTPTSVYNTTPRADDIWDRLVVGSYSVYRKIFPKLCDPTDPPGEPCSMPANFQDTPAMTTVHYSLTSANPNTTVYAGVPGAKTPGDRGEFFIPHLGGVQEHFLYGIQNALRPQGFGTVIPPISNPAPPISSRPQPASFPPGTDPTFCNWDPAIGACHWYNASTSCFNNPNDTSPNPVGICPPIFGGKPLGGPAPVCGDPICEGRRCNPYEYSLPNDYRTPLPNGNPVCAVEPLSCIGTGACTTINSTNWANDEYSDPRFNGCRYTVGPGGEVRVRTDAWDPGRGGCAALCNFGCR